MAPPRKGTLCSVWGDRGISQRQQEGGRVPGDPRAQECGNVAGAAACRNFPKYRPSPTEAARRKTQEEFGGALTLPGLGGSSITPTVSCLPRAAPLAVPSPACPSCTPYPIQHHLYLQYPPSISSISTCISGTQVPRGHFPSPSWHGGAPAPRSQCLHGETFGTARIIPQVPQPDPSSGSCLQGPGPGTPRARLECG